VVRQTCGIGRKIFATSEDQWEERRMAASQPDEPTPIADAELADAHARALDATGAIVDGVSAEQWSRPTPCDGWNVRELLNHIIAGNLWVAPLVDGQTIDQVGDRFDGDVVGDDPAAAYRRSATPAAAAFAAPGALDRPVAVSYGPVPARVYCGHRLIDVLIHGWDLAVATDQDPTLAPDLVEACWAVVAPQADLLVGSGAFGTTIDPSADADPQERLLGTLGRRDSGAG
jgi:uncharacterized protein (TIGR03086 family)